MSVLLCILISIAVNLDNFLIGINLGLKNRRLTLVSNILIAAMTALATALATLATWLISEELLAFGNLFGAVFLILFGCFCLLRQEDDQEITEKYKELTLKKSLMLGLVLSVNCIPPAFSAGMLHISPLTMGLCTGLFSFCCMFVSNRFGTKMARSRFICRLTPLSDILLIITGIMEIVISI